ncbi:hypothetical protein CDAR_526091 [Caerostris darwini]|uniref:Uncharacterized protein n=1 Tax=Caerostris darwini TaxID=1538125 RepID=A0AAV4UHZ3_9ARAC|nr:hypothetical protein CDAR_526091 [Caerostris darwini]
MVSDCDERPHSIRDLFFHIGVDWGRRVHLNERAFHQRASYTPTESIPGPRQKLLSGRITTLFMYVFETLRNKSVRSKCLFPNSPMDSEANSFETDIITMYIRY